MQQELILTLHLRVSEVNDILKTLGELPTKSNAYPLLMNIKTQAEAQLNKEAEVNDQSNPEPV